MLDPGPCGLEVESGAGLSSVTPFARVLQVGNASVSFSRFRHVVAARAVTLLALNVLELRNFKFFGRARSLEAGCMTLKTAYLKFN